MTKFFSLARRATAKLSREFSQLTERLVDSRSCTFSPIDATSRFGSFLGSGMFDTGTRGVERELPPLYLQHRFDLLGSGWVRVEHGMSCAGLEGIRFSEGKSV